MISFRWTVWANLFLQFQPSINLFHFVWVIVDLTIHKTWENPMVVDPGIHFVGGSPVVVLNARAASPEEVEAR